MTWMPPLRPASEAVHCAMAGTNLQRAPMGRTAGAAFP